MCRNEYDSHASDCYAHMDIELCKISFFVSQWIFRPEFTIKTNLELQPVGYLTYIQMKTSQNHSKHTDFFIRSPFKCENYSVIRFSKIYYSNVANVVFVQENDSSLCFYSKHEHNNSLHCKPVNQNLNEHVIFHKDVTETLKKANWNDTNCGRIQTNLKNLKIIWLNRTN